LHNELHRRRLFRDRDVRKDPGGVAQAYRAALGVDTMDIIAAYRS
jgi:hypothetical protein